MTWYTDRRLDYIDWRLATAGELRLEHIMSEFDLSYSAASQDVQAFLAAHDGANPVCSTRSHTRPFLRDTRENADDQVSDLLPPIKRGRMEPLRRVRKRGRVSSGNPKYQAVWPLHQAGSDSGRTQMTSQFQV